MSVPVAWVVGLLVALEPQAPWRGTYGKTAEAIARAAESDPLFGDHGEERTAALLVAIAWHESRFKPNAVSANKQYVCLFQIDKRHLSDPDKALADQETCTRAAMKIIRASLEKCASKPENDRLAIFMSGACDRGVAESRYRMFLAQKLVKEHPMGMEEGGAPPQAHAR
jgi:hypothetical protein